MRDSLRSGPGPIAARRQEADGRRSLAQRGCPRYPTGDGYMVCVVTSPRYQAGPEDYDPPKVAGFLGTLGHGFEIRRVRVYLVGERELGRLCGVGTAACYYPQTEEMVIRGDAPEDPRLPPELVIAHEYGHHLAKNRDNAPWSALNRGTKRWSSYEDVCRGIRRGVYSGSPVRGYYRNPGEAFAEAFAFKHYPRVIRWQWTPSLRPDTRASRRIDLDTQLPWIGGKWYGRTARLSGDRDAYRTRTALDGHLRAIVKGDSELDLYLRARNGRTLASATADRYRKQAVYEVCGRRQLKLVVRGPAGTRYRLILRRP